VLLAASTPPGAVRLASPGVIVYCDNVSAVYMTANPVHHRYAKHIEINIHFVRKKVALGQVRVLHVPSAHQFAGIMTKGLPVQLFSDFQTSLCVRDLPATTAGIRIIVQLSLLHFTCTTSSCTWLYI
jgi:hypothetical protein